MNTHELLGVIQTLKETGFNHIDLTHEGSHILLSNMDMGNIAIGEQNKLSHSKNQLYTHEVKNESNLDRTQVVSTKANSEVPVTSLYTTQISSLSVKNEDINNVSHENMETHETKVLGGHMIESPIVGTFYAAANPESENFVSVGSMVKKGQVLCIIEAMKLMNEIESDIDGQVVEILAKNEDGVEYGQPLFRIV